MDFGGFDFGGFEGGGVFDGLGGAAEHLGSGAADWAHSHHWSPSDWGKADGLFGRIFGASEGAIGEGIEALFSRFGNTAANMFGEYLDYEFYKKFSEGIGSGNHHSWENWNKFGKSQNPELVAAAETIKSHSLILKQLEKHAAGSELLEEYTALGINLPSKDMLKSVKITLSKALYPKEAGQDGTLMAHVNNAVDVLGDSKKTEPYRNLLSRAGNDSALRGRIQEIFKEFSGKQSEFYEKIAKRAKLLLPFHGRTREEMNSSERISHSIHEGFKKRGNFGKGAIVFTTVAGTSFLAYYLATRKDKSKNPRVETHVEKLSKDNKPQTAITL